MSGRSAHVRKKITETKAGDKAVDKTGGGIRNRARSATSSDDNTTISDYAMPMRQDTGVATTNARFLKFSEPTREVGPLGLNYHQDGGGVIGGAGGVAAMGYSYGGGNMLNGSGSQSGGSSGGSGGGPGAGGHFRRPLEDFAYARARRPNIRTEDVSGIEKSVLRNVVDKKSEGVRKGLARAFAFGRKNNASKYEDTRPPSAATVRPGGSYPGSPSSDPDLQLDDGQLQLQQLQQQEHLQQQQLQQLLLQQQQQQSLQHQQQDQYGVGVGVGAGPLGIGAGAAAGGAAETWDMLPGVLSPPPSAKLPPLPPSGPTAPPIKRWIGAGRPVQRWNKLRKDPELWDPNGDVLVFFGHKGQQPRPNPSFRLSSHIIEATESRYLITLLREGSTEEDIQLLPSPMAGGGHRHAMAHHGHPMGHHGHPMAQMHGGGGGGGGGGGHHGLSHGHGGYGQPTPPISEDNGETDGQISYEMYFPTPANMSKTEQLRHHITTRNVFALLYHASLVGLSLFQALADLHARLEAYMPPETDNVGTIINYLGARGIDDVRNDPDVAVALLAWSESVDVRWEEGWRESFLHCAGMYARYHLEVCAADFKSVTPITRALLERACLETQLRVQAAEERLAEFQFADMWPMQLGAQGQRHGFGPGQQQVNPAKAAADRLQKFFIAHYSRVYGRWPPLPPPTPPLPGTAGLAGGPGSSGVMDDDIWLTRTVAQALQRDFAALYDYLVDRDIVWDGSEARAGRKWMLVSESGHRGFEADSAELPMTDMLVEFDNKQRFPHIPHPYPLVPESVPTGLSGVGTNANNSNKNGAVERRVQLAYTVATNMLILGSDFSQSDLIDAFSKFEKIDRVGDVDPALARRGRWVLIYGILQTLASVSVDAPNVRYRDNITYHLSPRLKGARMPPWSSNLSGGSGGGAASEEAAHELSHCWIIPHSWNAKSEEDGLDSPGGDSASTSSPLSRSGGGGGATPGGFAFPRPPTMDGASTVRSGGSRSVRSSASVAAVGGGSGGPPFGSFGLYTPSSSVSGVPSETSSMRGSVRRNNNRVSKISTTMSGGVGGGGSNLPSAVEEAEWPMPMSLPLPLRRKAPDSPLPSPSRGTFLMRDDGADENGSQRSHTPMREDEGERRRNGDGSSSSNSRAASRARHADRERPLLSRDLDEADHVAPTIRDFDDLDDLDVIDDHEP